MKKNRNIIQSFLAIMLVVVLAVTSGVGASYLYLKYNSTETVTTTDVTPTSTKTSTNATKVASKMSSSVVAITTESVTTSNGWYGQYVTSGAGSGVIYSSDGYIVTCAHVVDGASKITVATSDDKTYTATLVGSDSSNDIAVIKIDATGLTPATFANSSKIAQGASVYAVGNPEGKFSNSITSGIISSTSRTITISLDDDDSSSNYYYQSNSNTITIDVIQTDAAVSPGNSGGGLFDASGNLIGIVNAKSVSSGSEGLGFAIHSNTAKKIIQSLIK